VDDTLRIDRGIARSGPLPALACLPELEFPEQFVRLLLGQQRPARGLLALLDEARKDRLEILRQGRGPRWRVALKPLVGRREALAQPQNEAAAIAIGEKGIGSVVSSPQGREAGVWMIAETTELPTQFRRIVATDDQGRYLVPDLPQADYNVLPPGFGPRGADIDSQGVV
jgi:hypothetical protein